IADRRVIGTGVLRQSYAGTRAVDVVAPSVGEPVVVRVPGGARTSTPVRGRKSAPVPVVRERVTVGAADAGQDLELELEVSARGFWQVHPGAARTFVTTVLDWLRPQAGEHTADLYAGVGLFAAALAQRVGPEVSVIAIEGDRVATDNARDNLAHLPWVGVQRDRVDRAVRRLLRSGSEIDLVVLEPPRTGAGRQVCRDLADLHPR